MIRRASLFFVVAVTLGLLALEGVVTSPWVWPFFYAAIGLFVLTLVVHLVRRA